MFRWFSVKSYFCLVVKKSSFLCTFSSKLGYFDLLHCIFIFFFFFVFVHVLQKIFLLFSMFFLYFSWPLLFDVVLDIHPNFHIFALYLGTVWYWMRSEHYSNIIFLCVPFNELHSVAFFWITRTQNRNPTDSFHAVLIRTNNYLFVFWIFLQHFLLVFLDMVWFRISAISLPSISNILFCFFLFFCLACRAV